MCRAGVTCGGNLGEKVGDARTGGSVQLLYSVISVHVFAILVYNEDRGWCKVFIW